MPTIYAYARVSTTDQTLEPQLQQLARAGVDPHNTFSDYAVSGTVATADRAALGQLLALLAPGDVLVVVRLDRLGRSAVDILNRVEALTTQGVVVRSLAEGIDSSTPAGRMVLGVMASLAGYERELTMERMRAGIAAAKLRGVYKGRAPTYVNGEANQACTLASEGLTRRAIAAKLGCSKSQVDRWLAPQA